jgi:hypothetical protein
MKNTRTIAAVAWLIAATTTPSIAFAEATAIPVVIDQHAVEAPVHLASALPRMQEPWAADYPATVETDGATVYASELELVESVHWALERFAAADLDLPHVEVWMHSERWGCQGSDIEPKAGYYVRRNGTHVIFSCGPRFILLHELAHVWDHHTLSADIRDAFLEERGLESWGGGEWRLRGAEHLANVIAWGLDDQHTRPMSTAPCDNAGLYRAFAVATGGAEPLE